MNTIKINKGKTLMIAHRGLSGIEMENTAAAFIAGGNNSYYGMECDIHKTIDGVYVVIHDDNTERISPVNMVVKDSTYEELLNIPLFDRGRIIGNNYLKIITLTEYITICKRYQKECIIEFKNQFAEEDVSEVINIIKELDYLDHTIFISFYYQNLLFVRWNHPKVRLQFLTSEYAKNRDLILQGCLQHKVDLDLNYKTITKDMVAELHENNIKVNCWTVDDPKVAQTLVSWGVDFITTNILE